MNKTTLVTLYDLKIHEENMNEGDRIYLAYVLFRCGK